MIKPENQDTDFVKLELVISLYGELNNIKLFRSGFVRSPEYRLLFLIVLQAKRNEMELDCLK